MPRSASAARSASPSEAAAARPRRTVALGDLDIAPENLRAGEAADAEVPLLADALFAAGQLQALTVRPGRRREKPWMALDGRRRLLALRLLADQGRIEASHPVEVIVETDPVRQAAAVVLTNTAAPVHVADVIAAIGRMLKSRLGVPVIARALGYGETEVKRLAVLSALPETALQALRAGRMTLRQARLLARLKDPEAQAEFARAALDGQGFPDWRVNERLDAGQVDASDPRCGLVTPQAYAAAGGAIETDLFDERPPVLRDPARLTDLWTARAQAIAAPFEAEGLTVHVAPVEPPELPDDLETAGYVYGGRLGGGTDGGLSPRAGVAGRRGRGCGGAAGGGRRSRGRGRRPRRPDPGRTGDGPDRPGRACGHCPGLPSVAAGGAEGPRLCPGRAGGDGGG